MSQSITKEFLKAFHDKYTYTPTANLAACRAIMWCILFMFLSDVRMYFHRNNFISLIMGKYNPRNIPS